MAVFQAVKCLNPIQTYNITTTNTISKGVPVVLTNGIITVAGASVLNILGIAHETVASGNGGTIKVLPANGPNGPTIFKGTAALASTSCGASYTLSVATNASTIELTADTTLGAFYAMTADGTNFWGVFSGNAFEGAGTIA